MNTLRLHPIHLAAIGFGLLLGCIGAWLRGSPAPAGGPAQVAVTSQATPAPAPVEQILFSLLRQEPESSPDLLPAGAPVVYAFYTLPEVARSGAPVVVWRRDGKPMEEATSEVQADQQRPGHGMITLRPPQGKLGPGIYEVELKTEQRTHRASFVAAWGAAEIVSQQAPAEPVLTISQHSMCRGVNARGEPVRPTDTFAPREKIHFAMRYAGAEPGTAVTITWWRGGTELRQARREITLPAADGWAHAWMEAPQGLPTGAYRAQAEVSGGAQELATAPFHIR